MNNTEAGPAAGGGQAAMQVDGEAELASLNTQFDQLAKKSGDSWATFDELKADVTMNKLFTEWGEAAGMSLGDVMGQIVHPESFFRQWGGYERWLITARITLTKKLLRGERAAPPPTSGAAKNV